jgi:hypothetical protein
VHEILISGGVVIFLLRNELVSPLPKSLSQGEGLEEKNIYLLTK